MSDLIGWKPQSFFKMMGPFQVVLYLDRGQVWTWSAYRAEDFDKEQGRYPGGVWSRTESGFSTWADAARSADADLNAFMRRRMHLVGELDHG